MKDQLSAVREDCDNDADDDTTVYKINGIILSRFVYLLAVMTTMTVVVMMVMT